MNNIYGNNRCCSLCRCVYGSIALICVSAMLFVVSSYAAEPKYDDLSIKERSLELFDGKPGFDNLWNYHDDAHMFELASGIAVNETSPVVGFHLQMNIVNKKNATVCIDGVGKTLKDTELDLITNDYAIECKSGVVSKKTIKQLEKEHTFLQWCKVLWEEIRTEQVTIECIEGHARPIFVVYGPSTYNNKFRVVCSWIDNSCETSVVKFINIIKRLAHVKLLAFFAKEVSQPFKDRMHNIVCKIADNISYEDGYDMKKVLAPLIPDQVSDLACGMQWLSL